MACTYLGQQFEQSKQVLIIRRFLLAKIYLDFLEDKLTPKAIINALDKFQRRSRGSGPDDRSQVLANAFDDAMQRVNAQSPGRRELALQVLGWITCARRPLATLELQHALAVELNKPELDKNNLADIQDLVSVCAGLVTIDEESMAIRLVHYTLQEYLENTQDKWFQNPQAQMALKCVTYLSFSAFEGGHCQCEQDLQERLWLHPFYSYAACNWGHHAREAETSFEDMQVFLRCRKKVQASSQVITVLAPELNLYSDLLHDGTLEIYGLHLAAYFGIRSAVLGQLVNNDPNSRDQNGRTPISYAAENGHVAIIKVLLDKGAEIEPTPPDHRFSPLSLAVMRNHTAAIELLIENGAFMEGNNGPMKYGNMVPHITPLSIAAHMSHETTVQMLLDKGANLDSKDQYGRTALSRAARRGHKAIVDLLLKKGANIESKDNDKETPLLKAAKNGHASLVMFLLEKGADINSKDEMSRTPLWWASEESDAAIVKLLLEKGAHVDPQDDKGITPLSLAVTEGDESLVSLLLQNGASCTIKDKHGRTPLSWAEEKGYETIVQMLKRQR